MCVSFLSSRSSFTLCWSLSVFPFSWCLSFVLFLFFLLRSPIIWFIVFTAVNFHLVLFFFQFFIWPPPPPRAPPVIGCCIVVVVLGGGCVNLDPSCIAPGPFLPLWPLIFVALSSVPWPLPLRGVCPLVTCSCCSGALVTIPAVSWRTFTHHTLPPHSQTTAALTMTHLITAHRHLSANLARSPYLSTWVPSLRAAKVAKAAAAVANSSSSPVKELRDLSAMDAFRSRSISVSEHAVRRLEKSLMGNQTKNNNNPNTCCFPPWDGWWGVGSLSCGSVGWFVARETPGEGGACWFVCWPFWFVLGWDHTRAVLLFVFYDLLLHAVFAADIRKYLMFLHLILL